MPARGGTVTCIDRYLKWGGQANKKRRPAKDISENPYASWGHAVPGNLSRFSIVCVPIPALLRFPDMVTSLPGDDLSPDTSLIQLHVRVHAALLRGVSGAGEDELAVTADGDTLVRLQGVAGVDDGAAVDKDVLRGDQLLRFRATQAVDHREYGVEALGGDRAGQLLPRRFERASGRRHDLAAH